MKHLIRRLGAGLLSALILSQAAFAHTTLTRSAPAQGSTVASPAALTLEFGDEVRLARVQILSAGAKTLTLPLERGAPPAKTMVVAVPGTLGPGQHTVTWRAIADDGHVMTGEFLFSVR